MPTHPTQVSLPLTGLGTNIVTADGTSIPYGPFQINLDTSAYTVKTVCSSGCNYVDSQLQAAINAATCNPNGEIIEIGYQETINASLTLPATTCAAGQYLIITTTRPDLLPPPGQRINLTYSSSVPHLIANVINTPAIVIADSASNWVLQGFEIDLCTTCGFSAFTDALLRSSGEDQTSTSQVPSNIILDRMIFHGSSSIGLARNVAFDAQNSAILNSWLDEGHEVGADAQAIWLGCTPGILLIDNNYLSGAAETFLSGGSGCTLPQVQANLPNDISFMQNYIYVPESWRIYVGAYTSSGAVRSDNVTTMTLTSTPPSIRPGDVAIITSCTDTSYNSSAATVLSSPAPTATTFAYSNSGSNGSTSGCSVTSFQDSTYGGTYWSVKNSFESKVGIRWLLWGNVLQNMWASAQSGRFIAINAVNQTNTPQAEVGHIEVAWNKLLNGYGGFIEAASNSSDNPVVGLVSPIYTHDNVAEVGTDSTWYAAIVSDYNSTLCLICNAPDQFFNHNTIVAYNPPEQAPYDLFMIESHVATGVVAVPRFAFHNSIIAYNSDYGAHGDCQVNGISQACWTTDAWYNNIVYDTTMGTCDSTSFGPHAVQCPVASAAAVGFTNFTQGGDYQLTSGSIGHAAGTDGLDVGVSNYSYLLSQIAGVVTGIW